MNTKIKDYKKIKRPIYCGIIATLCWIIGDLLIAGFTPDPESYPLLSQTYLSKISDIDIAVLMLSGSTERLMVGAMIAVFSIPLYLYSTFAIYRLVQKKYRAFIFILIFSGFAYAPLGHAAFFYVGEIYKLILKTDISAHPPLLETANNFIKILKINWVTSLSCSALGWLIFGIFVALGKTKLKQNLFWLNPITFFFLFLLIIEFTLKSPIKDWVACAIFNEAHFLFYLGLLFMIKKQLKTS